MTIEQQQQLDQSAFDAAKSVEQRDKPISTAIERSHVAKWFKIGAQTILDNPKEWGLMPILDSMQAIEDSDSDWKEALSDLKDENERYREALERIVNTSSVDAIAFPL